MIALKLNAGNDPSGNPRRLLLVVDDQACRVAAVDEGYLGERGALEAAGFGDVPILYSGFAIKVAEYRALLRDKPNTREEVIS
jgi:hypothetical protein